MKGLPERGIGNGISILIMIGIIAALPTNLMNEITTKNNLIIVIIEVGVLILVTASVVLLTQGQRRIPVQYAKRVVGRKGIRWYNHSICRLRVNGAAGVMPIIFAQSIMFIPSTHRYLFPRQRNGTVSYVMVCGFHWCYVLYSLRNHLYLFSRISTQLLL